MSSMKHIPNEPTGGFGALKYRVRVIKKVALAGSMVRNARQYLQALDSE